jgi:hypothetical protein
MAKANLNVIRALRLAAHALEASSSYQWGHMGSCNCGFLAQVVTSYTKEEIHRRAMLGFGDWSEQLNDYCPVSGRPFDDVISALIDLGFDADELRHLEKLSDPKILCEFPAEQRNLSHNVKAHAVKYMKVWAEQLEGELIKGIALPEEVEEMGYTH